jgi:hypothetical protein
MSVALRGRMEVLPVIIKITYFSEIVKKKPGENSPRENYAYFKCLIVRQGPL